jgi:hypothetical protein
MITPYLRPVSRDGTSKCASDQPVCHKDEVSENCSYLSNSDVVSNCSLTTDRNINGFETSRIAFNSSVDLNDGKHQESSNTASGKSRYCKDTRILCWMLVFITVISCILRGTAGIFWLSTSDFVHDCSLCPAACALNNVYISAAAVLAYSDRRSGAA